MNLSKAQPGAVSSRLQGCGARKRCAGRSVRLLATAASRISKPRLDRRWGKNVIVVSVSKAVHRGAMSVAVTEPGGTARRDTRNQQCDGDHPGPVRPSGCAAVCVVDLELLLGSV